MAVKAPTAPTPPTAPTVPQVTLEGGGSVTQSTAPPKEGTTSKSTDTEQQLEEKAREAVAQGEGGLTRVKQTNPREEAEQAARAARQAQQAGQDGARATRETGEAQAKEAARVLVSPESGPAGESQAQAEQAVTQVQAGQRPPSEAPGGHGALYWGASLALIAVLAFMILRYALSRRGRAGELTAADLADDGSLAGDSLRGLKPDEVLARLEERERLAASRQPSTQATPAQEALRRAARPPHHAGAAAQEQANPPKATASAQGARQIAREYRSQSLAEPPKGKKPAPVRPAVRQKEEDSHFEVRV